MNGQSLGTIKNSHQLAEEALLAIERMAREGRGPTFTQKSAGCGYRYVTTGETTEDFCAALIALEKTK